MKSKPEEPLFIQESRKGCSESMQIVIDYIDALTAYGTEKEADAAHVRQANENYRRENAIAVADKEKAEARCRELEVDARIGRSRLVAGWLRGNQFIGVPEKSLPSDTVVFTLELGNTAIAGAAEGVNDGK